MKATSGPLYPLERHGTHCIGGWVGPRVGLDGCGKSHPATRIRSPDRPACSESLYRLSYPGPSFRCTCMYATRAFVAGLDSVVGTRWFCDVRSRDVVLLCSDSACLRSMSCTNNEGCKNDYMSFWNERDACDVARRHIPGTGQHTGTSQLCQVLGISTEQLLKGLYEDTRSSTALFLSTSPILYSRFSH